MGYILDNDDVPYTKQALFSYTGTSKSRYRTNVNASEIYAYCPLTPST